MVAEIWFQKLSKTNKTHSVMKENIPHYNNPYNKYHDFCLA